jgi:hypothetical protein
MARVQEQKTSHARVLGYYQRCKCEMGHIDFLATVALVDRLVAEKLGREAERIRAEGSKWTEVAPEFAYGRTYGLRQLRGEQLPLSPEEQAARNALQAEMSSSSPPTPRPRSCRRRSTSALPKSKSHSPPSTSGRSGSSRPTSPRRRFRQHRWLWASARRGHHSQRSQGRGPKCPRGAAPAD